jgi:hypothetical protein
MSRSDYERPAWYQINTHYRCQKCGHEQDEAYKRETE